MSVPGVQHSERLRTLARTEATPLERIFSGSTLKASLKRPKSTSTSRVPWCSTLPR